MSVLSISSLFWARSWQGNLDKVVQCRLIANVFVSVSVSVSVSGPSKVTKILVSEPLVNYWRDWHETLKEYKRGSVEGFKTGLRGLRYGTHAVDAKGRRFWLVNSSKTTGRIDMKLYRNTYKRGSGEGFKTGLRRQPRRMRAIDAKGRRFW